jgi:hypothetical protein
VNRDSIIKGLAVFAAVVLVLFLGFSIVKTILNSTQDEMKVDTDAPVTLDSNTALKATIDSLEATWQKIQTYSFRVNQDPLHLGRVLANFAYRKEGFKEMEEEEGIRLTATVVDDHPKAIIKFRGKSYVVQTGQNIEQIYRVVDITNKQVVLESGGSRIVLTNKPVKTEEESGGESDFSNSADMETTNY